MLDPVELASLSWSDPDNKSAQVWLFFVTGEPGDCKHPQVRQVVIGDGGWLLAGPLHPGSLWEVG